MNLLFWRKVIGTMTGASIGCPLAGMTNPPCSERNAVAEDFLIDAGLDRRTLQGRLRTQHDHATRQSGDIRTENQLDLGDGILEMVELEACRDQTFSKVRIRHDDPAGPIAIDFLDDAAERLVVEDEDAFLPRHHARWINLDRGADALIRVGNLLPLLKCHGVPTLLDQDRTGYACDADRRSAAAHIERGVGCRGTSVTGERHD